MISRFDEKYDVLVFPISDAYIRTVYFTLIDSSPGSTKRLVVHEALPRGIHARSCIFNIGPLCVVATYFFSLHPSKLLGIMLCTR